MTTVLLPTFGTEGMRIRAVKVGSPVHGPDAVGHRVALFDIDGGFLVGSASQRQTGVLVGDAEVERHGRL